ncbi:hypothetical protein ACJX0J_010873, partial [Zea mays]
CILLYFIHILSVFFFSDNLLCTFCFEGNGNATCIKSSTPVTFIHFHFAIIYIPLIVPFIVLLSHLVTLRNFLNLAHLGVFFNLGGLFYHLLFFSTYKRKEGRTGLIRRKYDGDHTGFVGFKCYIHFFVYEGMIVHIKFIFITKDMCLHMAHNIEEEIHALMVPFYDAAMHKQNPNIAVAILFS